MSKISKWADQATQERDGNQTDWKHLGIYRMENKDGDCLPTWHSRAYYQ